MKIDTDGLMKEIHRAENALEEYSDYYHYESVTSPDSRSFEKDKDITEYTFTVKTGDYIKIEYASVIFTPNTGKPSLGFK